MRLVLSGGWFGEEGLYSCEVKEVIYPQSVEELKDFDGFVILSYELGGRFLELNLKETPLPKIVALKLSQPMRFEAEPKAVHLEPIGMSLSELEFKERVDKVKGYIERGDVYQINLSTKIDFSLQGKPSDLFLQFWERQPVPYGFLLELDDLFVMSGSMELFLEKRGKIICSKPIKGTGKSPDTILASEKERAENLMITDMVRNDIGRVARTGSVRVAELFKVEEYETLCQMHSTVEGETGENFPRIIRETFPPASVTGAPKHRAVQVIDELEPHPRGYYCGAAGFVEADGDFTLSVLIRTAFGGGSELSYFAGCGIVWDSDPDREWKELLLKTKAFYP
ncbi:para-aminobenzoate synthetase component 1 [Hydrogenivirga caldilitoris]|uniref:Para-aminobenzoate synthetase component 1 n=1 Tax=Hydrogenivirga caldilitoris TaxID=246264 RepID=A0A497XNT7_9AQUI|nr:anthranilate synthase component I family protein [Hydrogenivirga caldilitoris]RLJ69779.1 para-aminobenzoate synthetase component 1 [Hydrogenivirga caldilitoris]